MWNRRSLYLILIFLCTTFCLSSIGWHSHADLFSHRNFTVKESQPGVLKIQQGSNVVYKIVTSTGGKPTATTNLTIDLSTIDMTPFANMYRQWSEVPIAWGSYELVMLDANRNGRKEIYASYLAYSTPNGSSRAYEFDGDSAFTLMYVYADTLAGAYAAGDYDGDGRKDAIYWNKNTIYVLTQNSIDSLPTHEKFRYSVGGTLTHSMTYDINGDGRPELVYNMQGTHAGPIFYPLDANYIEGYDSTTNSFKVLYYNKPQVDHTGGFAIGDFDGDGKQNIVTGGMNGMVFVYEHQLADSFSVQSLGYAGVTNAYVVGFTHDMDGNGRPEIWVGGDTFVNGNAVTRLAIYEANADDSYQIVYRIDILGVFSFFAGNMVTADFDHDGKDELLLCIDQLVLIFKSNGPGSYYLWYMRTNELADQGANSVIWGSTVADLDNDGIPEILVTMDEINAGNQYRRFARIYKQNRISGVDVGAREVPTEFRLEQNFPNPFNGETVIRYRIPVRSAVTVVIYDILGREVRNIDKGTQIAGEYEVRWNGKGNDGADLSSGIYLIRLSAGAVYQTKKAILLK